MVATLKLPELPESAFKRVKRPSNVTQHVLKAINSYSSGDFQTALQEWDKAVSLDESEPTLRLGRSLLLINMGRFDDALNDLDAVQANDLPADLRAEFQAALAVSLYGLGRASEAVSALDEALAKDDTDLRQLRQEIVRAVLSSTTRAGFASWSGGKPAGSHPPIEITPGPFY
jgi:tetratricopeptide (TPR) repeat protein